MTFNEIRTEILDRLNLSSSDASTRVGRAINRKYRLVTSSIGLELSRRSTVQANVTMGVSTLIWTNTEKVVNVYDRSVSPYKRLDEVSLDELEQDLPFTAGANPTCYAIQAHSADTVTILFNRVPQTVYTLYADVYQVVADLSGTNEPAFSESFHDVIIEGVLSDELRKMEKGQLASLAQREYERILSDLRMWIAKSAIKDIYQGKLLVQPTRFGGGGSGGGSSVPDGAASYTQTGLITFDRDPSAPFAVTASSAKVDNLNADLLDGFDWNTANVLPETGLSFTDITTGNVTSTKHGFAPKSPADATKFLNGAATPAFALVKDSDLSTSDITTNDYTTSKHGFVPKGSTDTAKYLRADGTFNIGPGLIAEGRLTLTSATPITTADVTAATSVLWTPYKGNRIALFDGTNWKMFTFTETTLALGTLVKYQGYDVFGYDSSGTVTLEAAEWANATVTMTSANPTVVTWTANGMATGDSITFTTSGALPTNVVANTQYFITTVTADTFKLSTTRKTLAAGTFIDGTAGAQSGTHTGHNPQFRQTALAYQNGVLVKSGTTTRRYLGSFLTTATTTTEDSFTKRFLYNYYNRVPRELMRIETAGNWNYTLITPQQANDNAANQVETFTGVAESRLQLRILAPYDNANAVYAHLMIGENATNNDATNSISPPTGNGAGGTSNYTPVQAMLEKYPAIGYKTWLWLENSIAAGTTRWWSGTAGGWTVGVAVGGMLGSIEG